MRSWRPSVGMLVLLAVASVPATSSAAGGDAQGYRWVPSALPSPVVPATSQSGVNTTRVACAVAGACAATGITFSPTASGVVAKAFVGTLVGGAWSETPAPLPPDADTTLGSGLSGISCVPELPLACVAVGSYRASSGSRAKPLIEELANGAWTASSPSVPGSSTADHFVADVSCLSTTCIAVAPDSSSANPSNTFDVYTRANGVWTVTTPTVPLAGGAAPGAISCTSPASCVVVGRGGSTDNGFAATLAGGTWTAVDLPTPPDSQGFGSDFLNSVSCATSGTCIAVGTYNLAARDARAGLIETLAGGSWTAMHAPEPGGVDLKFGVGLNAVSCPTAGTCTAVGQAAGQSAWAPVAETLSLGVWRPVVPAQPADPPNANFAPLTGVACASVASCTAFGYLETPTESRPFVEQGTLATVTTLTATPAVLSVQASHVLVSVVQLAATLMTTSGRGVPGEPVRFFAHGTTLCNATTDGAGVATCDGLPGALSIIEQDGYSVSFAGDTTYLASFASAPLISV